MAFVRSVEASRQSRIAFELALEAAFHPRRPIGLVAHRDGRVDAVLRPADQAAGPIDGRDIDAAVLRRAQRSIPRSVIVAVDRRRLVDDAAVQQQKKQRQTTADSNDLYNLPRSLKAIGSRNAAVNSRFRARVLAGCGRYPQDTAKTQMASRSVNRLRHARRRAVTTAIVRRAQIRAALHHLARNFNVRRGRIEALVALCAARIDAAAA